MKTHFRFLPVCLSIFIVFFSCQTKEPSQKETSLIERFGARADGKTLCTKAIQKAIDNTSEAGGGKVLIPAGKWISGTLHLKSGVNLHLEAGAVLLGSANLEDYNPSGLIIAESARNISITGRGEINGRGHTFWLRKEAAWAKYKKTFGWVPQFAFSHPMTDNEVDNAKPGNLLEFTDCKGVVVSGVRLRNSERWTCHLVGCDETLITGVNIKNRFHGPNVDGIDLEACRNAVVSNCYIETADDAICLKNRDPRFSHRICQNIAISNCVIKTPCNGFKIGTGTHGDFRNITVSNLSISSANPEIDTLQKTAASVQPKGHYGNTLAPLSGIAIESVDGGSVEGVNVSNIVMDEVRTPIFIRLGNRGGRGKEKTKNPKPGSLKNIQISNVQAFNCYTASSISGIPGAKIENVLLRDVRIYTRGDTSAVPLNKEIPEFENIYPEAAMWGRLPVGGFLIRHAKNVRFENVGVTFISPERRPALYTYDVDNDALETLTVKGPYYPKKIHLEK